VYGRTTGVGSNRDVIVVGNDDLAGHGLRLARSHAGGAGELISAELGRAMLVVRLNQIAAGGSVVDPGVLDVLVECVNRGLTVPVQRYGAIGTGDLTALALTVLCLVGERDWLPGTGPQPRFAMAPSDAPAFISSNAATQGEAAVACHGVRQLLAAALLVAAFSHLAVDASTEPYAPAVHEACPHPGQQAVAAAIRGLLTGQTRPAARIQDPYGCRAFPQVHGPVVDTAGRADRRSPSS
jgi:histidine ammonia-lyase